MKNYTIKDLSNPEVYVNDPELALLARGAAKSSYESPIRRKIGREEFEQKVLAGKYPDLIYEAIQTNAWEAGQGRRDHKALAAKQRQIEAVAKLSLPNGYTATTKFSKVLFDDAIVISGQWEESLCKAIKRIRGYWDGVNHENLRAFIIPLENAHKLQGIFDRWQKRIEKQLQLELKCMTKQRHYTPEGLEKCLRHEHNLGGLLDKPRQRGCAACNLCGKWIARTFYLHGQIYGGDCINILITRHNQPALFSWRNRHYNARKPPTFDLWNLVNSNWCSDEPTETPVLYLPVPDLESVISELRKILNFNIGGHIVFIKERLPAFITEKTEGYSHELILLEEYENRARELALLFAKSHGLIIKCS